MICKKTGVENAIKDYSYRHIYVDYTKHFQSNQTKQLHFNINNNKITYWHIKHFKQLYT